MRDRLGHPSQLRWRRRLVAADGQQGERLGGLPSLRPGRTPCGAPRPSGPVFVSVCNWNCQNFYLRDAAPSNLYNFQATETDLLSESHKSRSKYLRLHLWAEFLSKEQLLLQSSVIRHFGISPAIKNVFNASSKQFLWWCCVIWYTKLSLFSTTWHSIIISSKCFTSSITFE